MTRPLLLDLFCKAGGAAVGYHRVGFDVVGIDIEPQPHYPFPFVQADALTPPFDLRRFDAIHASPPCQRYTVSKSIHNSGDRHPDHIAAVREMLAASGRPWVIENVPGSPLGHSVMLCGLMFGLRVIRHRYFECSMLILTPDHKPHPKDLRMGTVTAKRGGKGNGYSRGDQGLVCVAGHNFCKTAASKAMGIDWMTTEELAESIPPCYTEYLGRRILESA
jgi:DNA (cytosine-5)-methyltransferase 1